VNKDNNQTNHAPLPSYFLFFLWADIAHFLPPLFLKISQNTFLSQLQNSYVNTTPRIIKGYNFILFLTFILTGGDAGLDISFFTNNGLAGTTTSESIPTPHNELKTWFLF